MKKIIILVVLALVLPNEVTAQSCSPNGYSIVFVNGVLNDQEKAQTSKTAFEEKFKTLSGRNDVSFYLGHNQSHFAGVGDFLQSVAQTLFTSITNYDRDTILRQIHNDVATQKILLVGHSQGTFYTNEIYDYLTSHGVPKESIAVYNLATPANYVAGGGNHLTSANDQLVLKVRRYTATANLQPPLDANILIPISAEEATQTFGGHSFSGAYLSGAPARIVSEIQRELEHLKASSESRAGCFDPPSETLSYNAQKVVFSIGDPASLVAKKGLVTVADSAVAVTKTVSNGMVNAARLLKSALMKLLPPRGGPSGSQTTAAAFALTPPPSPPAVVKTNTPPPTRVATPTTPPTGSGQATPTPAPNPPAAQVQAPPIITPPVLPVQSPPPQPQSPVLPALVPVEAGFGGGGGGPNAPANANTQQAAVPAAPVFVPLDVVSPLAGATFATTSVTFTGTTTAGFLVAGTEGASATTTVADADGNWTLSFVLPEGENELSFSADDGAGNMSDIAARTITIDTTAPDAPVLSIAECADSFSSGICMIATTTITLVWDAVPGAAFYSAGEIAGPDVASTTATSQQIDSVGDRVETIFYVNAYDSLGNSVRSNAAVVLPFNLAVTINEIAWSGTGASADDEWIELSNNTDYTIDLTHFTLASADSGRNIALSGSIAAHGYYLIERREEATSQPSDLVTAFEFLSNDGEQLLLLLEDGPELATFDLTPAIATCGGWCEGTGVEGEGASTMERAGIFGAVGSDASVWQTYGSSADQALGADGSVIINGTPRAENSTEPAEDLPIPDFELS